MKYKNEKDILEVIRTFEDATIPRGRWTHAEHLVVALYYLSRHTFGGACYKMRNGIFNLLINGFKVDLTKEMPYHETLTRFWMETVADFNASRHGKSLKDKTNELVKLFDKDFPLRFYTRELLFSDRAREEYVEPNIASGDLK